MSVSQRVLFLDFDGVVLTADYQMEHGSGRLDPSKVAIVDRLATEHDLQIVVSSAWRGDKSYLRAVLTKAGLSRVHARNLDETPRTWGEKRGIEILTWLCRHPGIYACAILDDDDFDMAPMHPWLVRTDSRIGLTEEHVPLIVEKFQRATRFQEIDRGAVDEKARR